MNTGPVAEPYRAFVFYMYLEGCTHQTQLCVNSLSEFTSTFLFASKPAAIAISIL